MEARMLELDAPEGLSGTWRSKSCNTPDTAVQDRTFPGVRLLRVLGPLGGHQFVDHSNRERRRLSNGKPDAKRAMCRGSQWWSRIIRYDTPKRSYWELFGKKVLAPVQRRKALPLR